MMKLILLVMAMISAVLWRIAYKVGEEMHRDRCGWRR